MPTDDSMSRREFLAKSALSAATLAVSSAVGFAPSRAHGANDRVSIGVIGAGGRGGGLMGEIHKISGVEITAVCDTWRVQRERVATQVNGWYGGACRMFSNYEDLLALDDIDGVIIATPDFAHARILADAVKAGKDAFCEKPMATELPDAIAALDAAKQSDRVIQIGTQRRSEGAWRGLAKVIQSGMLGTISRVEVGWNDCGPRWNRGFGDLKAEDVDWQRFLMGRPNRPFDPSQYRRWHFYREFTNGTIALLGSHYLDMVHYAMSEEFPSTVVANGGHYVWKDGREHEDTVYAIYDYPSGFACRYLSGLGNECESGMRIYGTNGMFNEHGWTITGTGGRGANAIKEAIKVQPEGGESHIGNWVECMRSRKTTTAPVETGYQHSVACIMGYQALVTGRKLKYLPVLRRIVEA